MASSSLLSRLSLRLSLFSPLLGSAPLRCPRCLPCSVLYSSCQAWGARFRERGAGKREAGLSKLQREPLAGEGRALLLPPWLPTSSHDVGREREGAGGRGETEAAEGAEAGGS